MKPNLFPSVSDDLTVTVGAQAVKLSPRQGIQLSERLARVSFRQLLVEEAEKLDRQTAGSRCPAKRGRRTS